MSATILLISLGLCGANVFAWFRWGSIEEAPDQPHRWVDTLLGVTGWTELALIAISLVALIALWVIPSGGATSRPTPKDQD